MPASAPTEHRRSSVSWYLPPGHSRMGLMRPSTISAMSQGQTRIADHPPESGTPAKRAGSSTTAGSRETSPVPTTLAVRRVRAAHRRAWAKKTPRHTTRRGCELLWRDRRSSWKRPSTQYPVPSRPAYAACGSLPIAAAKSFGSERIFRSHCGMGISIPERLNRS